MPKEYTECVKSYVKKGKPKKDAQRICAIRYYKKHGKTPQQDESSQEFSAKEIRMFNLIEIVGPFFED